MEDPATYGIATSTGIVYLVRELTASTPFHTAATHTHAPQGVTVPPPGQPGTVGITRRIGDPVVQSCGETTIAMSRIVLDGSGVQQYRGGAG